MIVAWSVVILLIIAGVSYIFHPPRWRRSRPSEQEDEMIAMLRERIASLHPPAISSDRGCPDCDARCVAGSCYCAQCGMPLQEVPHRMIDPVAAAEARHKVIHLD